MRGEGVTKNKPLGFWTEGVECFLWWNRFVLCGVLNPCWPAS